MDAAEAAAQAAARQRASQRLMDAARQSPLGPSGPRTGTAGWEPAVRTAPQAAGTDTAMHDTGAIHVPTSSTPTRDYAPDPTRAARRSFGVSQGDQ